MKLLKYILGLHPCAYSGKTWPTNVRDYDRKIWSHIFVIPNLHVSDDATNYVYYFALVYLASQMQSKSWRDMGMDELFYYHDQVLNVTSATEIKDKTSLHKLLNQAGDIFEALGGICQTDQPDALDQISEMGIELRSARYLHGKWCALAENIALLVNATNLEPIKVITLLNVSLTTSQEYSYAPGQNKCSKRRPWNDPLQKTDANDPTATGSTGVQDRGTDTEPISWKACSQSPATMSSSFFHRAHDDISDAKKHPTPDQEKHADESRSPRPSSAPARSRRIENNSHQEIAKPTSSESFLSSSGQQNDTQQARQHSASPAERTEMWYNPVNYDAAPTCNLYPVCAWPAVYMQWPSSFYCQAPYAQCQVATTKAAWTPTRQPPSLHEDDERFTKKKTRPSDGSVAIPVESGVVEIMSEALPNHKRHWKYSIAEKHGRKRIGMRRGMDVNRIPSVVPCRRIKHTMLVQVTFRSLDIYVI